MKAILVFKLPEEKEDHDLALNGYKWKLCWDDLRQKLRAKHKYEDINEFTYDQITDIMGEIYDEYINE